MRFVDMMNQLEQDIAWPDEAARPDAVLVLEPMANAPWNWPRASNMAATPETIDGKFIAEFLQEAEPLPSEAIPKSFSIEPYQYKFAREERDEKDWPTGLPQVMPDFYSLQHQMFVVSSFFREVLEEQCPGCVEYTEIRIDTPAHMIRAPAYYYLNVMTRAQMVDWPRVDMLAHELFRGRPIQLDGTTRKAIPYKPFGPNDPLIWHEMDLDKNRRSVQGDIMVRGRLWNILIERFPQQFMHHNQLSKDD